jgi:hypothetical protein
MVYKITFDASPRQVSKLRNGHAVRIKKGTGFNLVVHPENYNIVSRAFAKDKGVQLKLTPEELETNYNLSPEQHEELGMIEGGNIFKKIKKAFNSKAAKKVGRVLKPVSRVAKKVAREMLHEKIAEAHMEGADRYGDDDRMRRIMNVGAEVAHKQVGNGLGAGLGAGMWASTDPVKMAKLTADYKQYLKEKKNRLSSTGTGLYAGRGISAHDALKMANMATAQANHLISKMHNASVHGMITQPTIKGYYDSGMSPISRGSGISNHINMIRGRGSILSQDDILPPALQSQPYSANFHMQFQLPPQYKRYHDGTDMEGRGFYA